MKYKGKGLPIVHSIPNIRLGFYPGYRFSTANKSRAAKCIVGFSINWNGEGTLDCTILSHCASSTANCIFDKDNYDIGLAYLIEKGVITKAEALEFSLSEGEG